MCQAYDPGILDDSPRNQVNNLNPAQIIVAKNGHTLSGGLTDTGSGGRRMGHKMTLATTGNLSISSAAMIRKSMSCEH